MATGSRSRARPKSRARGTTTTKQTKSKPSVRAARVNKAVAKVRANQKLRTAVSKLAIKARPKGAKAQLTTARTARKLGTHLYATEASDKKGTGSVVQRQGRDKSLLGGAAYAMKKAHKAAGGKKVKLFPKAKSKRK